MAAFVAEVSTTPSAQSLLTSPMRSKKGVHQYLHMETLSSEETDSTQELSSEETEKSDLEDCCKTSAAPVPPQPKFSFGAMAKRMQAEHAKQVERECIASPSPAEGRPKFSFGAMARRMQKNKDAIPKDVSESSSPPSFSFGALASRLRDKAESKSSTSLQSQLVQDLQVPLKSESLEDSQLKQLKAERQNKTDGASTCQEEERLVVQNSTVVDSGEKVTQPCPVLILRSKLYTIRSTNAADDDGDFSPYHGLQKAEDSCDSARNKFSRLCPSRAFKKRRKEKCKLFRDKECLGRKVGYHHSFKRRGFAK